MGSITKTEFAVLVIANLDFIGVLKDVAGYYFVISLLPLSHYVESIANLCSHEPNDFPGVRETGLEDEAIDLL